MIVIFRVDASAKMGHGHVMRCLTLASALMAQGADCHFVCRAHPGHMSDFIKSKGCQVSTLPAPSSNWCGCSSNENLEHAAWLGASIAEDARQTIEAIKSLKINFRPCWLIVDHYALDFNWEKKLRLFVENILVIDDLADRKHDCDLLLDQTFERKEIDYHSLVSDNSTILTGSRYALLRSEFLRWREYSLKRRVEPVFKRLLITMGGVDPENFTGQILQTLKGCSFPEDFEITVILGAKAPHIKSVKTAAKEMSYPTQVNVGVSNMAKIIAESDLAIGAAGTTTWERCCLGLPSILWVLADNQKKIASNLHEKNIVILIDKIQSSCEALVQLGSNLQSYSMNSIEVCDGLGVDKVVKIIYEKSDNRSG